MNEKTKLDAFMELEYKTLADAHFNTSHRVTNFFQYTLAIYTAPIILFTDEVGIADITKGLVFGVISIIGLFICMYLCRLRFETLLYARAVNGVRRYFWDNNKIEPMRSYNTLSTQNQKPAFYEKFQFSWILCVLGFINSAYLFSGLQYAKDEITNCFTENRFENAVLFFSILLYKHFSNIG